MTFAEYSIRSVDRLVAIDCRSDYTNYAVVEACLAELQGFEIECIDYRHETNVDKRVAIAHIAREHIRVAEFSNIGAIHVALVGAFARACQGSHP